MASAVIDTGYAWVVCTASFMVLTVIGVFTNAQGIFYIMYKHGIEASDSSLTLITSLNTSAIYIVGPFVGLLTAQFGERPTAILGAVMATGGLACSAFSTQVYHLYISFSLVTGFGLGIVLNPCITILDVYFLKHKRVAYGLVSTGYGVSSFIMPPILKLLEDVYGWRVSFRLLLAVYNVLQVTTAMESVPHEMVPVAVGIVHLSYVPGTVLGAPLSAWVYNSTDVYAYSFYFAGGLFLLSSLTMIPSCVDLHKQKPNNTP